MGVYERCMISGGINSYVITKTIMKCNGGTIHYLSHIGGDGKIAYLYDQVFTKIYVCNESCY